MRGAAEGGAGGGWRGGAVLRGSDAVSNCTAVQHMLNREQPQLCIQAQSGQKEKTT